MNLRVFWPCKCIANEDLCLKVGNKRLPLCSRCTGFTVGLVIVLILIFLGYTQTIFSPLSSIVIGLLLSLPTIIQGILRRYFEVMKGGIHEFFAFLGGFLVSVGAYLFGIGFAMYL